MKYVIAKIGTMSTERILLLKGKVKLGGRVEWVEGPEYLVKYGHRHTGIIDGIGPDGLLRIKRM